jgi:4a-hydroxytetrahydrobiopterin dehydratase
MKRLTVTEAQQLQKTLEDHWSLRSDRIIASFKFPSFELAMQFMELATPVISELNHHPEWSNSYKTIDITLSTHDVKGLSELDFELARQLSPIYKSLISND